MAGYAPVGKDAVVSYLDMYRASRLFYSKITATRTFANGSNNEQQDVVLKKIRQACCGEFCKWLSRSG
jgi:hypothetical protein